VTVTSTHRPLLAFFTDLALALALMVALSLLGGLAWALWQGVAVGLRQGAMPEAATLTQAIGQPGALALLWITLLSTGGAALIVYVWRRPAGALERARSTQAALRPRTWAWALATGAATFVFSSAATSLSQRAGIEPVPSNEALIEAVWSANPALMLAFAVALAPLYEELLFRRVLFGRLWQAGRPALGVALSSLAFASLHELPGLGGNDWQATALLWLVYAGMGAAFACLYWHTRTLWAPIAAHALNNALAIAFLKLASGS
jgi:hypothetical protein